MYNQDRKEMYLEQRSDYETRKIYFNGLFRQSEKFEETAGKDLCEFTTPEIENMLKTISYNSVMTFTGDLYQYGVYCDWCMKNGFVYDGQNHFREINPKNAQRYINVQKEEMSIVSREKLIHMCNRLPNPSDAAILLGVFEGIDGKEHMELYELKTEDLHKEDDKCYVDTCYRKHVPISDELYLFFYDSAREYKYYSYDSNRSYLLLQTDSVIKQKASLNPSVEPYQASHRIWLRGTRALRNLTNDAINLRRVHDSGIIWYTNKQAEAHGMKGEQYVRSKYFNEVREQYQNGFDTPARFLLRYGKFLK